MRLIDVVCQSKGPTRLRTPSRGDYTVYGAEDMAPLVARCALRYVLTDELAQLCAELAFSTDDSLTRCLDLVHVPAQSLWVEWNEAAELAGCRDFYRGIPLEPSATDARVGIHLEASDHGRRAELRFVWSEGERAVVSPFTAVLDLQEMPFAQCPLGDVMQGGWTAVSETSSSVAQLLKAARFSLEPGWREYYRQVARSPASLSAIRGSLGGPARTIPLLIAFLLLLNSREGVAMRPVEWGALNRKRISRGKHPLLSHVEAALALQAARNADPGECPADRRSAPRHHHVRGHLVRRHDRLFWRRPHVRGSLLRGAVKSRTVTLSFDASPSRPSSAYSNASAGRDLRRGDLRSSRLGEEML